MTNNQGEKMSRHQHYWIETGIPHSLVFLNRLWRYDCSVCGKEKYYRNHPVNPTVPSAWDVYESEVVKGNAHLVIAPPLIIGKESEYAEGQRYKQLLEQPK